MNRYFFHIIIFVFLFGVSCCETKKHDKIIETAKPLSEIIDSVGLASYKSNNRSLFVIDIDSLYFNGHKFKIAINRDTIEQGILAKDIITDFKIDTISFWEFDKNNRIRTSEYSTITNFQPSKKYFIKYSECANQLMFFELEEKTHSEVSIKIINSDKPLYLSAGRGGGYIDTEIEPNKLTKIKIGGDMCGNIPAYFILYRDINHKDKMNGFNYQLTGNDRFLIIYDYSDDNFRIEEFP